MSKQEQIDILRREACGYRVLVSDLQTRQAAALRALGDLAQGTDSTHPQTYAATALVNIAQMPLRRVY